MITNSLVRLLVWYSVFTALFRCPSSPAELTDQSPQICKPYLTTRSRIAPYIQPYYEDYAAPYVEALKPYIDQVDQTVYSPTIKYGKEKYDIYGAPRVDQVRTYGQAQWEKTLKPQFDVAQAQVKNTYDSTLAPHIGRVSEAAAPYYITSRDNVLSTYNQYVVPAYISSRPYLDQTYAVGHKVIIDTGLPYAQWAAGNVATFIDRTIWPQLRILYGENVEPQLMRIGERLGRYKDGQKIKAAVEEFERANESTSSSSTVTPAPSNIESVPTTETTEQRKVTPIYADLAPDPSLSPEQVAAQTAEKVEQDLKDWNEKFAKAAETGTKDLEERVKEIADRQIEKQVRGVGDNLVIQLEELATSELAKLKTTINKLIKSMPEEPETADIDVAELKAVQAVRDAGISIRNKAQSLRSWKQKTDEETLSLVKKAADSTLEVIDSIRDLGLQEIGMRWAWMEGVTYKDWQKYHALRATFDDWHDDIEARALEHEGLQRARDAAEEVESNGMVIAQDTAKELGRLKTVALWKVQAQDYSDDFTTRTMPAKAAVAARKVMDGMGSIKDSVVGTSQGTAESIASVVSEQVADAGLSAASLTDSAASKIAEAVRGSSQGKMESVVSAASKKAEQAMTGASEAIIGTPAPIHESIASEASNSLKSASSVVGSAISEAVQPSTPAAESASSVASSASSIISQASKKVFAGAMAQSVAQQIPVFDEPIEDDEETYSEKLSSFAAQIGDKYADLTRAVSEAIATPTTTQGSVTSITSVASKHYLSALSAASVALYGTEIDTAESISSVVSSRYADAVAA